MKEKEKLLDERITLRTEEYVCPATGETKVRTVQYIEKVIEKEVTRKGREMYIVLHYYAVYRQCRIVCGFFIILMYLLYISQNTLSFLRAIFIYRHLIT